MMSNWSKKPFPVGGLPCWPPGAAFQSPSPHVAPVPDVARALAAVEALIGQLYLAVLVAALVGTYVANTNAGRQRGD